MGLSLLGSVRYSSEASPGLEATRLPPPCSLPSVLPKFELLIDPAPYIRDMDACTIGTVQTRWERGAPDPHRHAPPSTSTALPSWASSSLLLSPLPQASSCPLGRAPPLRGHPSPNWTPPHRRRPPPGVSSPHRQHPQSPTDPRGFVEGVTSLNTRPWTKAEVRGRPQVSKTRCPFLGLPRQSFRSRPALLPAGGCGLAAAALWPVSPAATCAGVCV